MITAPEPSDARRAAAAFHLLGAGGKVWLCADACLELRPARSDCGRCRAACPVGAFLWSAEGVELNSRCTGCGLCAANCPSGALRVAGFEPEKIQSGVQRIECRRVPESIAAGAARVPCLGGVTLTAVLELAATSPTPWTLVDHGWCATCAMGNGEAAVAGPTLLASDSLLATLGLPRERWPSIVHEPLPTSMALAGRNGGGAKVNRRGFFTALARTAQQAAVQAPPVTANRGGCRPSPVIRGHRTRFAEALQALGNEVGGAPPNSLFPEIEVAADCDHQALCTALCPSGALRQYEDQVNGTVGLQFDSRMCIACGLCVRGCPSSSIRLLPRGNGEVQAPGAARKLTRHAQKICSQCGRTFVETGSSAVCPHCRTDRNLALSLFGTNLADGSMRDNVHTRTIQQPIL